MSALQALLHARNPDIAAISATLDAQSPVARLDGVTSLTARSLGPLFEAAKGHRPIDLDYLVPPAVGVMQPVDHEGLNNLPAFRRFAKPMCRPSAAAAELWGYNRNPALVERTVGPGYFVAYGGEPGEVLIDYTRLPTDKPTSWPPIVPNSTRLSRFVYHNMVDVLRGVSEHVTIGRAVKNGKIQDNWFILCRVDAGTVTA